MYAIMMSTGECPAKQTVHSNKRNAIWYGAVAFVDKKAVRCIMMRLDGYGLFVKDMGAMIRFYRDVLGFEIKEAEDTENVYLLKDGTLFLLYGRRDFEKLTGKRYEYLKEINAHSEMALYVDTFEEVDVQYQHAIQNGATSLLEPTTEPWGQRTCFIADPEGNVIEIGSWNKPYEEKDK